MHCASYNVYPSTKEAWSAMYDAVEKAQRSIHWEVYMFVDDMVGKPFFDLLSQKARAGIEVKIIVDSLGSFWLAKERVKQLRSDGVDILFFHERKHVYRSFWRRLWARTHRKVLIIDKQIGFIGGVNIRQDMGDWDDIMLRIEGEVVWSLLRYFAKSYVIAGGRRADVKNLYAEKNILPEIKAENNIACEFIFDSPGRLISAVRQKYIKALQNAKRQVVLFSPYYLPDKNFLKALYRARRRGVRIDILLPFRTDIRVLTYAAYAYFSIMRRCGVRVHLIKRMFHSKGMLVDNEWAMVGSSNIDVTSFRDNYEANVAVHDKNAVRNIQKAVAKWLHGSMALDSMFWEKRGRWQKIQEWVSLRLYRLWYR